MAIKIKAQYGDRANAADANYPEGSVKNESSPGTNDGTPLDQALANDYEGFTAKLLDEGGVTYSGNQDTLVNSDRMTALNNLIAASTNSTYPFFDRKTGRAKAINSDGGAIDLDSMNEKKLGLWAVTGANGWSNHPNGLINYGWVEVKEYSDSAWLYQTYIVNVIPLKQYEVWFRIRNNVGGWGGWQLVQNNTKLGDGFFTALPNTADHENGNWGRIRLLGNQIQRSNVDSELSAKLPMEDGVWQEISLPSTPGVSHTIKGICSTPDHSVMHLCTGDQNAAQGGIFRSTDDGLTWSLITGGAANQEYGAIFCATDGTVIAASDTGFVWRSTDGGLSYNKIAAGYGGWGQAIWASENGHWIAVSDAASVISTSVDNGASWQTQTWPVADIAQQPSYGCYVNESGNYWMVSSDAGVILASGNAGGATPSVEQANKSNGFGARLRGEQLMLAGDRSGAVWLSASPSGGPLNISYDGGVTWKQILLQPGNNTGINTIAWRSVAMTRDGLFMWVIGDGGTAFKSWDGGINWTQLYNIKNLPNANALRRSHITDDHNYFFISMNDKIYRSGQNSLIVSPHVNQFSYMNIKFVGN